DHHELLSDVSDDDVCAIWNTLKQRYERHTTASKLAIRQQLHELRMDGVNDVDGFVGKIKLHVMKLRERGINIDEDEKKLILLRGLPDAYAIIKSHLEIENKSFDVMCEHLRDQQER